MELLRCALLAVMASRAAYDRKGNHNHNPPCPRELTCSLAAFAHRVLMESFGSAEASGSSGVRAHVTACR